MHSAADIISIRFFDSFSRGGCAICYRRQSKVWYYRLKIHATLPRCAFLIERPPVISSHPQADFGFGYVLFQQAQQPRRVRHIAKIVAVPARVH
jgi:hypothetical protein